jgi:hypothetical protein
MKKALFPALAALLAAICLVPVLTGQEGSKTSKAPQEAKKELLARVGVLGASVSAGYGTNITLAEVLDVAIKSKHKVIDASSTMVFMDPDHWGKTFLDRLEKEKVTVVIGLDFFFWYSYGILSAQERFTYLKKGFAFADKLKCPLIVGDIPDMHDAVGKMLRAEQVPSKEELRALNKQLREWAAERPMVHIVPLSAWIDALKKGKPLAVNGKMVTFKKGELLQEDNLHAKKAGIAVLAVKSLESLAMKYPLIDRRKLILDYKTLAKTVKKKN